MIVYCRGDHLLVIIVLENIPEYLQIYKQIYFIYFLKVSQKICLCADFNKTLGIYSILPVFSNEIVIL